MRENLTAKPEPLKISLFFFFLLHLETTKWHISLTLSLSGRQRGTQTTHSVLKPRGWSSSPEGSCLWIPCLSKAGLECLQRSLHHLLILLSVWWIGGVHHCQDRRDWKRQAQICAKSKKNNSLQTNQTVSNPESHRSGGQNGLDNKKSSRILTIYYSRTAWNMVQPCVSHRWTLNKQSVICSEDVQSHPLDV